MGLFGSDSFLGSLLGGTKGSKISNVPQASVQQQLGDILNLLFNVPALGQGFQMATALGQNPWDYLNQFQAGASATGPGIFTLPGGNKLDIGKLSQSNAAMTEQYEAKQLQNFQDFYNKLGEVPAFADVVAKSKGQNLLTPGMNAAFADLGGQAIGSATTSGFITDPLKQQNVLGPVALQKASMEAAIQQEAQNKLLGLAGAGGLTAFSQNTTLGGGAAAPWMQAAMSGAGLFGAPNLTSAYGAASLNTQLGSQNSMFNAGLLGLSGGGGGQGSGSDQTLGLLSLLYAACWVADELYGVDSEAAQYARLYALSHDSPFLRLYKRKGKAWAAWLKSHPWAKPVVAPIWNAMAVRGRRMMREAAHGW